MTVTNTIATVTFDSRLFPVFQNIYTSMLNRARQDKDFMAKLVEYLKKFNLLTVREESSFKPKEIVVDHSQLSDARYRRSLIRQLKAPRPSAYVYHTLPVDQERLDSEPYSAALTEFLAQMTCMKLSDAAFDQVLVLARLSEEVLFDFFKERMQFELTAETLSAFAMRRMCERLVDDNPRFQAAVATIRQAGAEARAKLRQEMIVVNEAMLADFNVRMSEILAESRESSDRFLAELHQAAEERRAAEQVEAERKAAEDALNFGKTEQQLFAEKVKQREREYRLANKMHPALKATLWAGAIALTAAFAYFGEVNGVAVLDYLF